MLILDEGLQAGKAGRLQKCYVWQTFPPPPLNRKRSTERGIYSLSDIKQLQCDL